MWKIYLIIAVVIAQTIYVFADETYTKVDDYTVAVNDSISTPYTLEQINGTIADLDNKIAYCDQRKADFTAEKAVWEKRKTEAEKLGVKVKPAPVVNETIEVIP